MAGSSVRPSGSIANGGAEAEDAFPWFGRLEGQRLDATEIAVGSRILQANQTAAEPTSTYSPHVYHRGAAGSVSEGTLRLASPATPFPQAGGRLNCAGFGSAPTASPLLVALLDTKVPRRVSRVPHCAASQNAVPDSEETPAGGDLQYGWCRSARPAGIAHAAKSQHSLTRTRDSCQRD